MTAILLPLRLIRVFVAYLGYLHQYHRPQTVLPPLSLPRMANVMAKPTDTSDSSSGEGSGSGIVTAPYIEKPAEKDPFRRRAWDSFKRDPDAHITKRGQVGANGLVFDLESAAQSTAESGLARKLKGRHLQMIAIGGSIGSPRLDGTAEAHLLTVSQVPVFSSDLAKPSNKVALHRCSSLSP